MAENTPKVQTSLMHKGRKTVWHLQQMKNKGDLISMLGPASCDPLFTSWADAAGIDIVRVTAPGETAMERVAHLPFWIRTVRKRAQNIHINAFVDTCLVPSNEKALEACSSLVADGADSCLIMGITNDRLQYLCDNHVPMFGHVGCLSGWQTTNYGGYKRLGKTAEDAYKVYRTAYEYQECGMKGMTIELVPAEVAQIISEKLTIPVVGVAAGAPCDGSEMVIYDLLGIVPAMTAHARQYMQLPQQVIAAYTDFVNEVKNREYPLPVHGFSMDEAELEKFKNMVDADVH